jgi:hypothetical protein
LVAAALKIQMVQILLLAHLLLQLVVDLGQTLALPDRAVRVVAELTVPVVQVLLGKEILVAQEVQITPHTQRAEVAVGQVLLVATLVLMVVRAATAVQD